MLSFPLAIDLVEACGTYELERLGALLREAILEALNVENFAVVLRESHVRRLPGLKQGCMRFALYRYDELLERPEAFMSALRGFNELIGDLFRLSRRWRDEVLPGRTQSGRARPLRPAPAPPSTFVADFERLFREARLAEERETPRAKASGSPHRAQAASCQDLAPDCRIAVGKDVYLGHTAVLAARSDFFLGAFASEMAERASLLVTLQHVHGDTPSRGSVLALLYFLYTGKTTRVTAENAMEVLALVGGELGGDCPSERGGYLQLHDSPALVSACEAAAEGALEDGETVLALLAQGHVLGASRPKARAMQLAVRHFKGLALRGAFEALQPPLLTEVLQEVAVEYDRQLPSPAKGLRWELSVHPAPDTRLESSYAAASSPDLSRGVGAYGTAGCPEASLEATFERPVRVRCIRVGVDLTVGDFDAALLNGSRLQHLSASGFWQDSGVSVVMQEGVVTEVELPRPAVARAFRLVRRQRLAVGLLAFE